MVFVEGNYLLTRVFPWLTIRHLLDYCVFVEVDRDIQWDRLIKRHTSTGKDPEEAQQKVMRTDLPNSDLIREDMDRADFVYRPTVNFGNKPE